MLRHFSIKRKLTLLTLIVCMTSLVLGTVGLLVHGVRSFRADVVNELSAQARILAALSTAALTFNDSATATEMLAELKNRPHIHLGGIYQNGRLFASYHRLDCTDVLPPIEPATEGHRFESEHVVMIDRIVLKGERLGTIYLAADTEELKARLRQNLWILFSVFVASTVLALLLASRLQRLIVEPIQRLSQTAGEVAESRNYSLRVAKCSEDELGRLAEAFNQMLERIQAQDGQLKESQERYEVAVLGSSDGLWDLDLPRLTAYYSPRCRTMLGYAESEGPGDQDAWRTLTHPDDVDRVDDVFIDCWTGGRTSFEVEFRARATDGSYRWILARGAVLRDAAGLALRIAGSHTDITERKQSEAALHESESRFRSLIQSASEGIVQVDAVGRIVSWNRGAEALFGYVPDQILGEAMIRIVAERDRPSYEVRARRYLDGTATAADRTGELAGVRADGTEVPIEVSLFVWQAGAQTYLGAIIRDITERKRASRELEELNRRLVETSRQAGMAEIATGVLHNVGNVLNSVNVSSTLVIDRLRHSRLGNLCKAVALLQAHEADIAEYLTSDPKGRLVVGYLTSLVDHLKGESESNTRELASLVANVDHIKQIVAMQQSYARVAGVVESLPADDLIDDALQFVAGAYKRAGVELVRESEETPPVLVDKHKVMQVLINLFTNARQSIEEAGPAVRRVKVTVRAREPDAVEISIRDNGLGIEPANLTRIFQHGFTTKREGHGFGLHSGANAIKEIGGSISVHSEGLGHGAVFTIVIPCKAPAPAAQAA